MKTEHSSSLRRLRAARLLPLAGGLAIGLTACLFNQFHGVAQLSAEVVTGLLETNSEGDRVYVGTVWGNPANFAHRDAVARVQAIDPATGLSTGTAPIFGGTARYRAVAEDTTDSTVWLLRDSGTLDHRTRDLSSISSWSQLFSAPGAATLERMCDLEQLPNGHFVATGVYTGIGGDRYGFWEYVQPDPASPGNWYRRWRSYLLAANADIDLSCPRLSHETTNSQTLVLEPYNASTGTVEHVVSRYQELSWVSNGHTYYSLSKVGDWSIPVSSKWLVSDITAGFDHVIIARQHVTDLAAGDLEIYEQDTGVLTDSRQLERARAVDSATWAQLPTDASSVLWWGGLELDSGSDFELGVATFTQ